MDTLLQRNHDNDMLSESMYKKTPAVFVEVEVMRLSFIVGRLDLPDTRIRGPASNSISSFAWLMATGLLRLDARKEVAKALLLPPWLSD